MTVSTRKFLRQFALFRERAEQSESIVVQGRDGAKFMFHRVGQSAQPRRVQTPLPKAVTERWDLDAPALEPGDWEMNR
jgi:hypothetical protein